MATITDLINGSGKPSSLNVSNVVLQQAAEQLVKEKTERVVAGVKNLIGQFDETLSSNVERLRQLRSAEKAQATLVKNIDRAFRYFGVTGNPLPFYKVTGKVYDGKRWCQVVGVDVPADNDAAWDVPADWVADAA